MMSQPRTSSDVRFALTDLAAVTLDAEYASKLEVASAACHAAARKGDRFEPAEVRALLEALDETVWFPNCPHGRPILSVLDEAELGRRFLRR